MGFGQTVHGDGEHIRCQGSDGRVLFAVHHQPVVNLIGKQDQAVLSCQLGNLFQHLRRIHGAGGVIGVDDDDGLGVWRDFPAHILDVRVPVGGFIADIMDSCAASQYHGSCPQRVIRGGQQHLVAAVQEPLHHHGDQLADAVAGIHVVRGNAHNAFLGAVSGNGLSGGQNALGIRVAL